MKKHVPFRISPRGFGASLLAVALLAASLAHAQSDVMPPPRKMPRVPVKRQQVVPDKGSAVLKAREATGTATILDAEHLRINDIDMRLFGVVPPQLSAPYGPQARAVLDELTKGQAVTCHVRDRDRDTRFLATCTIGANRADLALELLKRGLAVTARGSVHPTELAIPYEAAEEAAQKQRLGIWAAAIPAQATIVETPAAPKTAEASAIPPLASEIKKDEKSDPKAALPVAAVPPQATVIPTESVLPPTAALVAPTAATVVAAAPAESGSDVAGFFARYQLLITGLVMLATALGIIIVLTAERRRDRREEMRAIAAALRGELQAARAVCQTRLKTWSDADEKASWPRIRSTLYQAYVGKIGWLGAVLARQVASIYGQASDYAAFFNPNSTLAEPRGETPTKRRALQTLVQHIEEVLPKLATIEQTGQRPKPLPTSHHPMLPPASQQASLTYNPVPQQHQQEMITGPSEPPPPPPTHYDPLPQSEAPSSGPRPIWNIVQRFKNRRPPATVTDDGMTDYTTLLEEEIARMSSEQESLPPNNVTKLRGQG